MTVVMVIRGELTSSINLRVTDRVRERLDEIASSRGVKVSVVVREFIDEGLESEEDNSNE